MKVWKMDEPYIIKKITSIVRTSPINKKELEEYYRFIAGKGKNNPELRLIEYLIRESEFLRFKIEDLPDEREEIQKN